jgi:predicted HTH transcriptional regulator
MSKTLLYNGKSEVEEEEQNKQVKIPKVIHEQHQQEEEEKEFIILKIYKSEIDKAIEDLKEHKKLNQYYQPDYKLIVERYTDKILDVYGWYESLKKTIRTTDKTLYVYDEL